MRINIPSYERCHTRMARWVGGVVSWLVAGPALWSLAGEPPADPFEFFEQQIRPVLVDKCYPCHSASSGKAKGGLLLDNQAGALKGGDDGPAIVPGKPDKSLLIKAIRYTDPELRMPPASAGGKMAPETIAAFEAWVLAGAPDPRASATTAPVGGGRPVATKARNHWAFQPVRSPTLPTLQDPGWARTPVDAFVLAKLEAKHLRPAPPADKRSLLRRACFDLLGLPPSPREMAEFLADESKNAFEKVVDRLLDSPRYGERWGRHWLDVARYADTKGYVFQEERRYAFSYTYRDYVIQAFNRDKPYDRFLVEQIAADRLELNEDKSSLAALGFLTLGRRFLNNPNDIIDDRIDLVSRGTMGLTVSCARCHDHKFDPIPTRDYYSWHGIFASSEEPDEKPLLGPLLEPPAYRDFLKKKADIEANREAEIEREVRNYLATEREKTGDYLLAAHDAKAISRGDALVRFAGQRKVETRLLERWMAFLDERQETFDPILDPWFAFAALPDKEFALTARDVAFHYDTNNDLAIPINAAVAGGFSGVVPASLNEVAAIYGQLFRDADKAWTNRPPVAREPLVVRPAAESEQEAIQRFLHAEDAPPSLPSTEVRSLIARHLDNVTLKYRQQVAALDWTHSGAPPRAMALIDRPQPHNSPVFIRGNSGNPGPEVPRQFLEILAGPERQPFTNGSGRLELAQAIASRNNPLTARVLVNRVWGWHFGSGLVSAPSDLGVRTEAPPQQDLLDWLAATFMDQGWSIKKLHRLIMCSSTYRQSSMADPDVSQADPDNLLLGHFNRRRLDFEATRDTLLAASGKLDVTAGGQPVDILSAPFSGRRTVYGFIDRQNLPGLFRTFDFANPDSSAPQRFSTTVPQQALFMMNSPFVLEQARALVNRAEVKSRPADSEKIGAIYQLLFQRDPATEEVEMARAFLQKQASRQALGAKTSGELSPNDSLSTNLKPTPFSGWEQLTQVFLLANELIFVD